MDKKRQMSVAFSIWRIQTGHNPLSSAQPPWVHVWRQTPAGWGSPSDREHQAAAWDSHRSYGLNLMERSRSMTIVIVRWHIKFTPSQTQACQRHMNVKN